MAQISRRGLLTSMAVAPVAGALLARAAAQTGVYGAYGAPPAQPPAPSPLQSPSEAPTTQALLEATQAAREQMRLRHFPNVPLRTQDNKKVRFYDDLIKDKIVVLNFFYSKCEGICPSVTANLVKVQKMLGDHVGRDIFMYSFTLKPEQDSPKVLKAYADMFHVGRGWTFLTGAADDIEQVRRGIGFVSSDPVLDKDKTQHIGNICYGNEPLMLWAMCPGMAHAKGLLKEISFVMWPNGKET